MTTSLPALQSVAADIVCLADHERRAAEVLDANAWAYFSGGAGDERCLQANRHLRCTAAERDEGQADEQRANPQRGRQAHGGAYRQECADHQQHKANDPLQDVERGQGE